MGNHILSQCKEILLSLKGQLIYLVSLIFAFLAPIHVLISIIFLFIVTDTIVGIIRVFKKNEQFTSRKLSAVISKLLLYNFSLIGVFILEKYLLFEFVVVFSSIPLLLTKISATFFSFIEIVSINENITQITGKNLFQEFKRFLSRVKSVRNDIDEVVNNNENGNP